MPQKLASLPSLRWRPSLLAENNQARYEAHPVARRVGGPPGPLLTNNNPLERSGQVTSFLHAVDQKKPTYFIAP
jgi:hypothetical protein